MWLVKFLVPESGVQYRRYKAGTYDEFSIRAIARKRRWTIAMMVREY